MVPRLENVTLVNPNMNNRVVEIIANLSTYQGPTLPVILLIEPVNVATVWSGLSVKETSLKNKTRSSLISPSGLQTLSRWFRNVICESETNSNSNKQFTNTIVSTSITRLSQTMKPSLKTTSNRIDNTLVSEDIDISSQILTHEALPKHIAVVMDGNGRCAKNRGLSRSEGHRAGVNAIHGLIRACRRLRIPFLTLYAFSSQNWARPMQEVETLMTLLAEFVEKDLEELCANGVRLLVNGDIARLPNRARSGLERMVEASRSNSAAGLTLCLALSYGGREEIIGGVAAACRAHKAGLLDVSSLTPESFRAAFLPHPDVPDPCLLIRTSGELRVSNFLLWQIAYTELYVTPALWPDFNEQELIKALVTFSQRERRFGKTSEQIASEALSSSSSSSSTSSLLVAGAVMLSQSQERSTRYDASVNANVSEQQYKHSNGLKSGVYSWRVLVVLSLVCLFIVLLLVLFVMNYYFSSTSLLSSMSTPTSSTSPLIHLSSQTPWPIPGPTVGKHHKTREL
jgi:undecaprenyl diphosphate synthase